jgi:hypothetical protein
VTIATGPIIESLATTAGVQDRGSFHSSIRTDGLPYFTHQRACHAASIAFPRIAKFARTCAQPIAPTERARTCDPIAPIGMLHECSQG